MYPLFEKDGFLETVKRTYPVILVLQQYFVLTPSGVKRKQPGPGGIISAQNMSEKQEKRLCQVLFLIIFTDATIVIVPGALLNPVTKRR